ncbi:hypothetical protein L1987_28585 [Smallanthus sonchifolius]|uniref:Uncharacterized protein n=1 Tax=Smallanthus sonchifolius TaxID=185202 RepID=A0ACB9HXN0_9ASTR|nr:hypothetical protein L1987_28585 [Smallanthus sonchifolius]
MIGKYTQSIRAKDICILLVNDDYVCQTIVADMLDHCCYEAFSYEREMDALNMIWEKKDMTELILTNVHRTYAKRLGIIEHIENKIKLQIIYQEVNNLLNLYDTVMSPDVDDINVSTVGAKGVTVYFMKCLSVNEMNNLWATALAREKNKRNISSGRLLLDENTGSKRMGDDNEHGNIEKKPRVVWTKEMHQKFLEAVAQLGEDKAFPKKIVELMNVPGLTRANVASHLQKYRLCMKRAQEGFTGSSYDFTNNYSFNTLQESFQQSHWNPFQMGSRNTATTRFNFDFYKSRSRTPQHLSLLKTIRLKPNHNFSVYGDETKNILLRSIEDRRVHPKTNFAGFRFARDGKSVVFGENSHLTSSVQQQLSFPDMEIDDSTHCASFLDSFTPQQSSVAPMGTGGEPDSISSQLSSLAALLAVDEPMPDIMTQLQPSAAPTRFDWNSEATQPPSSVAPPWSDWDEQLRFTCQQQQQQPVMTPPLSEGLQWTDWAEPPSLSPQQPPSGNTANANSDIFSDFTSSLPPEFCELGAVGDDNGVDATAISIFDDLLFEDGELT